MKNIYRAVLVIIYLFGHTSYAQLSLHDHYYDYKTLNKNNITITFDNTGCTGLYGATWNFLDPNTILFDMGPWVVGEINGNPYAAIVQWGQNQAGESPLSPGPIIDGLPAILSHPSDSTRYRVYKITRGDNSANVDYRDWPTDLGAPLDKDGNPLLKGDQELWTIFNAADSTASYRSKWSVDSSYLKPVPVEIQQTVFCRGGNYPDSIDIFSNVVFIEWTIINKGNLTIDSTYLGMWTDIDFMNSIINLPEVDIANQAGYLWMKKTGGNIPPAVGFTLLYGPKVPSAGSNAVFKGAGLLNYKNLNLSSFHPIADDYYGQNHITSPAFTLSDAWNIARGYDLKGAVIIDSVSGLPTKFPYSGDPVTKSGWVYNSSSGGGAGFNLFTGPVTLAPGDTQWVMFALVPALGKDNTESISILRDKISKLRSLPYDSIAYGSSKVVTGIKSRDENITAYSLSQNYPNPFNPATIINYSIPKAGLVVIKVYNVLGKEIATLVDEEKNAGSYQLKFNADKLASGVYFYRLNSGSFVITKKFVVMK